LRKTYEEEMGRPEVPWDDVRGGGDEKEGWEEGEKRAPKGKRKKEYKGKGNRDGNWKKEDK
jgi:hypothetical protein